jgi:hypothetical protein
MERIEGGKPPKIFRTKSMTNGAGRRAQPCETFRGRDYQSRLLIVGSCLVSSAIEELGLHSGSDPIKIWKMYTRRVKDF